MATAIMPSRKAYRISKGGHKFEITDDGAAHLWDDSDEHCTIDRSRPIVLWEEDEPGQCAFREGALIPVTEDRSSTTESAIGALRIAALLDMKIERAPVGKYPAFKVTEVG